MRISGSWWIESILSNITLNSQFLIPRVLSKKYCKVIPTLDVSLHDNDRNISPPLNHIPFSFYSSSNYLIINLSMSVPSWIFDLLHSSHVKKICVMFITRQWRRPFHIFILHSWHLLFRTGMTTTTWRTTSSWALCSSCSPSRPSSPSTTRSGCSSDPTTISSISQVTCHSA